MPADAPAPAEPRRSRMSTTPNEPVVDEDIEQVATPAPKLSGGDADGTDTADADGTDGTDGTDGADADGTDGTDGADADGTDSGDADGTDA